MKVSLYSGPLPDNPPLATAEWDGESDLFFPVFSGTFSVVSVDGVVFQIPPPEPDNDESAPHQ